MDVEVHPVPIEDKPVLRNLLELYRYDFSEFDGRDVGDHGLYGYTYLDHYWTEPDRHPFIVRVSGRLAGFALVRGVAGDDKGDGGDGAAMAEFFIMRKYRNQGVGENVAQRIFDLFPGRWEVSLDHRNHSAQAFWRAVIDRYTDGTCAERREGNPPRVVRTFRSLRADAS